MSHPISNLIRPVTNDYLAKDSSEKIFYFLEKSNRVVDEKPRFLSSFFATYQSYLINFRGSARGNYKLNWESLQGDVLKLNITYNLKCPHTNTNQVVRTLQDGPSTGYAFEQILQQLCEVFYDERLDVKTDGVDNFFALQESGQTIQQELAEYLCTEIASQIGFTVRALTVEADHDLELQEIKYPKESFLEAKNKEFTKSVFYAFDLQLKHADGEGKIYAITRHQHSAKFLPLAHAVVREYLLEDFSHHTFISAKSTVNRELTQKINVALEKYGRVVNFFDLKLKDVAQKDNLPLDSLSFPTSLKVENHPDPIIVTSKIAASVRDYGRFESIEQTHEDWLQKQVSNILENEVLGFMTYREVLRAQFIDKEEFLSKFRSRLQERVGEKGLQIDGLSVLIDSQFEFPELNEPIHHQVHCDVKNSNKLIVFGNAVHISIVDKVKYIENFEEPDLKQWLAKKLDKVVKGEIEFKDYKQVTLESIPSAETSFGDITNYKHRIKEELETATKKIGGEVKQILIVPELTPLKWLEEFTVSIENHEFKTAEDGVPIRLSIRLTCRVKDLSRLSDELLSPYGNIDAEIALRVEEALTKELLKTSSESAYLEFYENNLGHESVEEKLERIIVDELDQKFAAEVSYVSLQANSTPLVELYKGLRRGNYQMSVPVVNRMTMQAVTITFVFEVFGVARWNTFKIKCKEVEQTIGEVKKFIKSSLIAKLEMAKLEDLLVNDERKRRAIEESVQIHVDAIVGKRLGLHVRLYDYSREQTKIEAERLKSRDRIVGEKVVGELEDEREKMHQDRETVKGLRKEKQRIETAIKHEAASPEKIARLEEINRILAKRSTTFTDLDTNTLPEGSNNLDSVFGDDVTQINSAEDE